MSKHETWRTRRYWESVGGLLIEEYLAIPPSKDKTNSKRLIDGVIVQVRKKPGKTVVHLILKAEILLLFKPSLHV